MRSSKFDESKKQSAKQCKLYLFGSPFLEVADKPVAIDTRKALALLAYLVLTDQPHTRDALATLFWSEADPGRARAALRRTLSTLRTALDDRWLLTDREQVQLQKQADLWIDVDQFQAYLATCRTHDHSSSQVCPLCLAPLTQAVSLYRADFMAGFSLADSTEFDDWQVFQSEVLRRSYIEALQRLVEGHGHQRAFEPAIGYARRWLQADPLDEAAHRHLMRLYAQIGQRAAALRQYQECLRILEAELDIPPSAETIALHNAIQRHEITAVTDSRGPRPSTAPLAELSPGGTHPFQLPLVGRLAEWTALERHYAANRPGGRFILLNGEAGIGKTRLAEAFVTHVQQIGASAMVVRCFPGETGLAYGPFVESLRATLSDSALTRLQRLPPHSVNEVARLLPELQASWPHLPEPGPLDSPGAQSRFFQGLSDVIAALLSGTPPGVLFIDDLHWADESSTALMVYLVRRLVRHAFTILVTWRSEAQALEQRLASLLAEARRSGLGLHLTLERLSQNDVAALAESLAREGLAVPAPVIDTLYQETEGLPFFVTEYLTAMANGMDLPQVERVLEAGIGTLFQNRLVTLSETARQLLRTAATIGRSFEFETLWRVSDQDESEAIDGLESLLARGILREASGDLSYDFSHEKLRTLVYKQTTKARRQVLHRRVAENLLL